VIAELSTLPERFAWLARGASQLVLEMASNRRRCG
jgi:hypothetical protein